MQKDNRWDMGKNLVQYEDSFSDMLHQKVTTGAVHSGGIPIHCLPVTSRSRLLLLLSVVGNRRVLR